MVRTGKSYLEELLKPVDPGYECMAFRAANWSVSPSTNVVRALTNNGIRIDTSVFKYGRRQGIVNFDYTQAPSELLPWRVDRENICRRDDTGTLLEMPIYCEQRWLGAFLTTNRIHRAMMGRSHRIKNQTLRDGIGSSKRMSPAYRLANRFALLLRPHAWKADFNQCTGRQLIGALGRAHRQYGSMVEALPFILIGHSKLFNRINERSLAPFLNHVAQSKRDSSFGIFKTVEPGDARMTRKGVKSANHVGRQGVSHPHTVVAGN